jgi:hypothetical protein
VKKYCHVFLFYRKKYNKASYNWMQLISDHPSFSPFSIKLNMGTENHLDFIHLKVARGVGSNICDDISAKFESYYEKYCLIISAQLEVLTAVSMKMAVFWVLAPLQCHHWGDNCPDDGGSTDLRNADKFLPVYKALQPKRQPSS